MIRITKGKAKPWTNLSALSLFGRQGPRRFAVLLRRWPGLEGIYGVVSFVVAQRRQDLAVRIALGASRLTALWFVLNQGLEMATIGVAIGLLGAGAAQKLTSGLLFGVSPFDPLTFVGAAVFLLTVAALASAIPAAGVLRIDPARTLRQD